MENSKKISGEIRIPDTIIKNKGRGVAGLPEVKNEIEEFLNKDISKLLEVLLANAFFAKSSDIHVEPEEEKVKVRMRLDGVLHDVITINKDIAQKIVSRIKLLARVKLNIEDRPQDGKFTVVVPLEEEEVEVEIRMSALPSEHGETLVMRVLDPRKLISLDDLGVRDHFLNLFKKEIKRPNGMVIVTGPTGSGKTTTLYSFLKTINNPEVKIITIEDPIEYHLEGISQTEVDPEKGYDFANGLKAIVRQDPDVILVGEIRDLETAQISMQSALTGHLVFSTLHTNDAPGAIARLISLGEKIINIAPAINVVIAQRLIRKVCPRCTLYQRPDEQFMQKAREELKTVKKDVFTFPSEIRIPRIKGCKKCSFTGYQGRVGIFEAFLVDDEMEEFLSSSPSIAETKKKAIEKGMITMRQDGIMKVIERITTMEEIDSVT